MLVQVARIGKPHGIRGEVTVRLFTDAPEKRFTPGARLLLEPAPGLAPDGVVTVRGARWNKAVLVVALEQVPDRSGAETLRGGVLYAETEDEGPEDEEWYEHELIGLEVRTGPRDGSGPRIGRVTGLRTLPAQDLLEVVLDEDGRAVALPFVEQIVPALDTEGGFVVVSPPPGLLELGRGTETGGQVPGEPAAEGGR